MFDHALTRASQGAVLPNSLPWLKWPLAPLCTCAAHLSTSVADATTCSHCWQSASAIRSTASTLCLCPASDSCRNTQPWQHYLAHAPYGLRPRRCHVPHASTPCQA
eukprot:881091-Pelagomonas_calceolata.AAC.1